MTVLICGGAGYIGSHVNKALHAQGYETIVFDNLYYGHREAVKWGTFAWGDLSNISDIISVFQFRPIDCVMHFAAYAYVGESMESPEKYYENNVSNTLNLLRVMRMYHCNRFIFSSSCATYGIPAQVPITEDMAQNPINPYGRTKWMVEQILNDYHMAYGLDYAVLRYFNAAGSDPEGEIGESHDPETHVIPLILDAASGKRESFSVYGMDYDTPDGSCIRDYIHVSDLASAHLLALRYLEEGRGSDSFNLGNENGTSVLELVDSAQRVTGRKIKTQIAPRRPGDPAVLVGSSEKARRVLGWRPKYSEIDNIIRHAWAWHENRKF